jgi:hypothetical protein
MIFMIRYRHSLLLAIISAWGHYSAAEAASHVCSFSSAQAKAIARHTNAIQEQHSPFQSDEFAIEVLEPLIHDITTGLINAAGNRSFAFGFGIETCYPYLPTLLSARYQATDQMVFHALINAYWYDEHFPVFWNLFLKAWRIAHSSQGCSVLAERHRVSKADACKLMHLLGAKDDYGKTILDVFIRNFKDNDDVKESFNWVLQELIIAYRYCFPRHPLPCCDEYVKWLITEGGISFDFDDADDSNDSDSSSDAGMRELFARLGLT